MARLTQLSRSIAGKVAVVTGAASGMGRATAHLLADEGAAVAVLDRDHGRRRRRGSEITAAGGRALALAVDLADGPATDAALAAARSALGPVDILVNNAGISLPAPLSTTTPTTTPGRRPWP